MCVLPPTWLCLLLGLLPLEVQTRVLTVCRAHTHRLSSSQISEFPKPSHPEVSPTPSDLSDGNQIPEKVQNIFWRTSLNKDTSPELLGSLLYGNHNLLPQRGSRGRRHANGSGMRGQGQLMRVGCVLGTCQVQNLSHRLYQLIGQSGREDSSPINPGSPHSYG
ncbi:protein ADM2 [Nothobranchius furzeri]|uniref:Adrenomedullin 2b n=1 Tax=Nothobranchius furzeri TaxID=105023 RepID=A0A1A8B588_NOTFU|nr:protein ADM2 [Nothobranchius furzeri]